MNGFLIIDKPKGMTSQTVCLKLKRILHANKCGHNGTLDPSATGVMVVAVNQATKAIRLVNEHDKEYIATILFGYDSKTLDMDGEILENNSFLPKMKDLEAALEELKNKKTQLPPLTSAIKVNGKKLYEYQREGKEVEIKPREVTLYDYKILGDIRPFQNSYEIDILVSVSKGYFVRSLARDLGLLLGTKAIIHELRRTKSGIYSIIDAISLDEAKEENIIPIRDFFDLPIVDVKDYLIPLVKNGVTLDERQTTIHEPFYVNSKEGILGIYEEVELCKYKPILLFKEE